jgi:hypothetical protein
MWEVIGEQLGPERVAAFNKITEMFTSIGNFAAKPENAAHPKATTKIAKIVRKTIIRRLMDIKQWCGPFRFK